jgi:DNA repair ATPase RecN
MTDNDLREIEERANMVRDYYRKYPVENQLIHNDIPALLAEIRELRQAAREVIDMSKQYENMQTDYKAVKQCIRQLAALIGEEAK